MTVSDPGSLVVVGGGVIGLSAAREAARLGMHVTVLERGPGRGAATWAAAGMLSPLDEARTGGPFLEFGLASLRLYGSWVEEVESESGGSVEYRECGKLVTAFSDPEAELLREKAKLADDLGIRAEWLGFERLAREEPALASSVRGGLLILDDFRVDSRRLGRALAESCRRKGVDVRTDAPVQALGVEGGRVRGVTLADGSFVPGGAVLLAAGAWSGGLEDLPRPLPVRPIRGQMISLRPERPVSSRVLGSPDVYLVPRDDGRLLVGATVEDVGFEEANTAGGTRQLLAGALALVPALESAPVVEIWSGLRPGTTDGIPIIGPDPEIDGLFYATGHFRNGILMAPATARVVADLLAGEEPDLLPAEFRLDRLPGPGGSSEGR